MSVAGRAAEAGYMVGRVAGMKGAAQRTDGDGAGWRIKSVEDAAAVEALRGGAVASGGQRAISCYCEQDAYSRRSLSAT